MASINPIPEKIVNYNVYNGPSASEKFLGVGDETTLPDVEYMKEAISGAGILGEYDSPNVGHTGSMELEVPFNMVSRQVLSIAEGDIAVITLRGSKQSIDSANGSLTKTGLVVNARGPVKKITMGSVKPGAPMKASVTIELLYYKLSEDTLGSLFTLVELDKLNFVHVVNGVDKLALDRRYM